MTGVVFGLEGWIGLVVWFATAALGVFSFVNALLYSAASYEAAHKWNKVGWCFVLGLALLIEIYPDPDLTKLKLVAVVAPLVYLLDVRPALAGLIRR